MYPYNTNLVLFSLLFKVDFDTGSSDLFLPGPDCDSTCSGHTTYDTSSSSTAEDQGQTFSLSYGDGSTVSGEVYQDTVTIAGLTATSQAVGAASQYSSGFESSNFPPDGLMGMAFKEISEYNSDPVFQTLVDQGQVSDAVFGFTLLDSGAELYLGGTDSSKFSGDLTYTPVTTQGYWQINFGGITTGSDSDFKKRDDSISGIVDTGTTLIYGDSSTVSSIYSSISGSQDASSTAGSGTYTIPCDSVPDNLSVVIEGVEFPISADTFSLGPISSGSSDCLGGLVADDSMGKITFLSVEN